MSFIDLNATQSDDVLEVFNKYIIWCFVFVFTVNPLSIAIQSVYECIFFALEIIQNM